MKTETLILLLQVAAFCHLGLVWAGASLPKAVNLRGHLATLPPFIRRLFLVYFAFIGLVLIGFGSLTFFFAQAIAAGEPIARGLCALLVAFWTLRLMVATFVFDVRSYLKNWFYRLGYWATNVVFVYLLLVYVLALWKGGRI